MNRELYKLDEVIQLCKIGETRDCVSELRIRVTAA